MRAISADRVFTGAETLRDHAVLVEDGRVLAVVPRADAPATAERVDLGAGWLAPGFIDLQVNGGGGVLFNDQPTPDGIRRIADAHRRFGTTGLLPTLISDGDGVMRAAIDAVARCGRPGVLGIHLEGPFLNPERKGIHPARHVRRLTPADLALLSGLPAAAGRTMVTLAPELAPDGAIEALVAAGVIVSAGHTAAGYDAARAGQIKGIRAITHLFNAMTQLGSREPGVVGAALDDPATYCGVIVDGHHVHAASLRLAFAVKGVDRMFLVTDAMSATGTDAREFDLLGERVTRAGGRLTGADGTLAGADLDMALAVRNTVAMLGVPVETALRMASLTPATLLGRDRDLGRLAPGHRADLVWLDEALEGRDSWVAGRSMAEDGVSPAQR